MAFLFDYVTEAEVRNAAEGVESADLTTAEIEEIADQFAGMLHQETGRTTQYTADTRQWLTAKTYILEKCAAFIIAQFPDSTSKSQTHEDRALLALNSLKGKGKVSKTSGMNNYA